jgi:FMN-dependent NADH-azoreductase
MRSVLLVACSPRFEASASRAAAELLLARLCARAPGLEVIRRDLAAAPPPFVDARFAAAMLVAQPDRSPAQAAALAESERLIGELETTAALVIATPMNNFTVPAVLKAWIDQVLRVERTFRRTPAGKIGCLRDRPAYVVVAAGGRVSGTTARQPDFLTPYLTAVLATLGIAAPRFLYLEGLSGGAEAATRVAAATRAWLDAELPLAAPADGG